MRGRVPVLIALVTVSACGDLTDADGSLGPCAESTPNWWPLDQDNRWVYDEIQFDAEPQETQKELYVQRVPTTIGGLAGEQDGIRAWRSERDGTGWRWFIEEDSAFWFRRDLWSREIGIDPPCDPVGDVRECEGLAPAEETYFLPGRKRLDYSADRVCEKSAWQESYEEWQITIEQQEGGNGCPLDLWRGEARACVATDIALRTDSWSVFSIGRHIEVPAGAFDETLCVRRRETTNPDDPRDVIYCFALGVGKIYERDFGEQVECLAEYRVNGRSVAPADPAIPCNRHELDD